MSDLIVPWRIELEGVQRIIHLQTPEELHALPSGTVVYSILNDKKVVGVDVIDEDTRAGRTAFGLLAPIEDTSPLVRKKS